MNNRNLAHSVVSALSLLLTFSLPPVVGQELTPPQAKVCSFVDCIYKDFTSHYPVVDSISPDGTMLLLRTVDIKNGEFGASVSNLDGQILHSVSFPTPVLRLRWNPGSNALAFFTPKPDAIGRTLHIWYLATGRLENIPTPFTAAQPEVEWSPDGEYLAYASEEVGVNHVLIVVEPQTSKLITVPLLRHVSQFSWAPDSTHFAVVIQDAPNMIDLVGIDGHVEKSFGVKPPLSLVDFHFSPKENVLLLSLTGGETEPSYLLEELDWATGKTRRLATSDIEIPSEMWTPDGKSILFQKSTAEDTSLFSLDRGTGLIVDTKAVSGLDHLIRVFPDGQSVAVKRSGARPDSLVRVSLTTRKSEVLYNHDASRLPMTQGETQWISSFDGMRIPIIVWRPAKYRNPRSAVVICHGGIAYNETNSFDPAYQWLLKQGIPVVSVNFRGSSGYGKKFLESGNFLDRVRDVLKGVDYAHETFDVPYSRIILLGHSLGANYAAVAGRMASDHLGIVVLASLNHVDPRALEGLPASHPQKIVLLYGTYDDKIPLPTMLSFLVGVYGPEVDDPSVLRIIEVPDEHTYNSLRSWASVYRVVAEEMGISQKDICGGPDASPGSRVQ